MTDNIVTKQCGRCKAVKHTSCFSKNKTEKDGYQNTCKKCKAVIESIYKKTKNSYESQKRYRNTENGKKAQEKWTKKAIQLFPEKFKARRSVVNAVVSGRLSRVSSYHCRICWKKAEQYHHHRGYGHEHSFDITPLCRKCHISIHFPAPTNASAGEPGSGD